ncbi:MAG: hypothetical protein HS111_02440 [Kofleriaceae bacterium]|nr:hypothetical protein [Kofleriaceae bacterium]
MAKAEALGDVDLADRVCSSVPAQALRAAPRRSRSAIRAAAPASRRGGCAAAATRPTTPAVTRLLEHASGLDRVLDDEELHALARA